MQAIFAFLREFWRSLWPFGIVRSYQRGIRFRLGIDVAEIQPGWYFAWWVVEDVVVVNVVPDVLDLPVQSITAADGAEITVSANIAYEITDARAMFTKVQDFQDSLSRIAMNHLAQKIRAWTWKELQDHQAELERSLKGTLTTRLARLGWGVEIIDVGLTDLVRCRQYRLYQG